MISRINHFYKGGIKLIIKPYLKSNQGITLIALVITIIILLILAGISIASLTGENGILVKSQTAKIESKKSSYEEALKLINLELRPDKTIQNWSNQKYMNTYKQAIEKNEFFLDAKEITLIPTNSELIIQILTMEDWVYFVTENNIEFSESKNQILPNIYVSLVDNTLCFFDNEEDAKNSTDNSEYFYGYIGNSDYYRNSDTNSISTPWFKHKDLITQVDFVDEISPTNMMCYFADLSSLTTINHMENLKTERTTNMQDLFYNCTSLSSLDLSNFVTLNVTNMRCMFYNCEKINNLDLSNFNTSQVKDMGYMFYHCKALKNINLQNWDTSNVVNMTEMFDACIFETLDLSHFNTKNVKEMAGMFAWCLELKELNCKNFVIQPTTDIGLLLIYDSNLVKLDISNMNLSNHTANKEAAFNSLPTNAQIITNQDTKDWFATNYPLLENVVVSE